jgi:hypothetical protein
MDIADLLALEISAEVVSTPGSAAGAALLVMGDSAAELAAALAATKGLLHEKAAWRVLFGLPVLTLPYPILVNSVMTERNTRLDQLSLFGWVEDNAILEPRAEVLGLTPLGETPVLFLRDLDLDRPPEAWLQPRAGNGWRRIIGMVIAQAQHTGAPLVLDGDEAALTALDVVLSADAQALLATCRAEVAAGRPLRQVLRAQRRHTSPALMALCDGWRVLARAARVVQAGHSGESAAQTSSLFRLDGPRRW